MKLLSRKPVFSGLLSLQYLGTPVPLYAQVLPPQVSPDQLPNPEDTLVEPTIPAPLPDTPVDDTEALPNLPVQTQPFSVPAVPGPGQRFRVKTLELLGVTLNPEELNQLTAFIRGRQTTLAEQIAAIEGQQVTLDDLLAFRAFIGDAYVQAGYITSGAFLPEQVFTDGVVQIQVVEGSLEALEITGVSRLRKKYVRDRLLHRVRTPLQQQAIIEALQLLQLDPLIETVEAELLTGSGPGLSILSLVIQEAPPLSVGLSINNYRAASLGSAQITPLVSHTNLVGLGDRLDLSYSLTRGLNSYILDYTLPITPQGGTVSFGYATGNSRIITDELEDLGIRSENRTFSLSVRQPIIQTPRQELALGLGFDQRRSQTFLFDDFPVEFSPGAEGGESRVSTIRFFQDWVNRGSSRVLAARSQFSVGIDAFDATVNQDAPDGKFVSWRGQFQWAQRVFQNSLLVTRVSAQLTPDELLSLEQFSLGGVRTVRGYPENELVTDNGVIGSLELRVPLSATPNELVLTPFMEGGVGWNTGGSSDGLASVGLGLQWQLDRHVRLRVDYGLPLIEADSSGNALQDEGVYLSLDWAL